MIPITSSPYPGLRPFEQSESDIFFGREEQTDELLRRLGAQHFLAVIGSSGCGKSSLVRAGMLPALDSGFMASAGPRWRTATTRPGAHPFANLAHELLKESALRPERGDTPTAEAMLGATLRRGPLGLAEVLRETPLPKDANLLVLVDQFEEIFRFRQEDKNFEADAFVSLLLGSAEQRDLPIYIVITMRSDYIGNCAAFPGLPEAINKSEYLTPRLSREQMRAAIEGPARVFGGEIEPALVNRLLNDTGGDPENLPVLQHLLMRMWTYQQPSRGECIPPAPQMANPGRVLTFDDYKNVGGFEGAISQHANEAFNEGLDQEGIGDKGRRIAEIMYRRLCEVGSNRPDSRRPARFSEVTGLVLSIMADSKEEDVIRTANVFRNPQYGFLIPPCPEPLQDRVLDLPHESLIRRWKLLKTWADREADSASTYGSLEQDAQRYRQHKTGLWVNPDLDVGLAWKQRENPTKAWAARYGGDFEFALTYLENSRQARTRRRLAIYAAPVLVLLILAFISIGVAHRYQSTELARKAAALLPSDPEASMWLGLLAVHESPTFQAQRILEQSLESSRVRLTLHHHGAKVLAVAFTKDGKLVGTGADDGFARVWDVGTGREPLYSFEDRTGTVNQRSIRAVAFSQRGEQIILVTVGTGGRVTLRRLTPGEDISETGPDPKFTTVTLSADGNYIAASDDQKTIVWDVRTRKSFESGVLSPGGPRALSGDLSELFQSLNPTSLPNLWLVGKDTQPGCGDSHRPPGSSIQIWEIATGKCHPLEETADIKASTPVRNDTAPLRHTVETFDPSLKENHQELAESSQQTLKALAQRLGDLQKHSAPINSIAFSPTGWVLAVGREDGTVQLWRWRPKENNTQAREGGPVLLWQWQPPEDNSDRPVPGKLPGIRSGVKEVVFSPDGTRLATAGADGTVKVLDVTSGQERMTLVGHSAAVVAVSFSPNSNFLVTGSEDGTAKIWDVSLTPGDATKYMTSSSDELSKSAKERLATYGDDRKRELCFQYLNKECPRIR